MTRTPVSTYRLQVNGAFDLEQAAGVASYLDDLGVDWVYISPILQAVDGSEHGYDVTDHSHVDVSRGGPAGLAVLSDAVHGLGRGLLVDIVPNHVGVGEAQLNGWWWDVLTYGRESRYASAFDIDWDFGGGKVRLPVLGDDAGPELRIEHGELRYFDHRFPLTPGSADDGAPVDVVLERQHYALMHWRCADRELNYRRFFAVTSLAGIRVEHRPVFDESHAEILRWIDEGLVDGLRVDHPDGLADPRGYLQWLADGSGGRYVVVEKILARDEQLPTTWATAGTTGYEALADIDRVLVAPGGADVLTSLDQPDGAAALDWSTLIHDTKRAVADGILNSEIRRIERDLAAPSSADAIAEIMSWFQVYRSYLPDGRRHLDDAVAAARRHRPDLVGAIDTIVPRLTDPSHPGAIRFQQTSGMVMAKGVEDCAFYRYNRLGSLTEVGGDPAEFSIGADEFHRRQQQRLGRWNGSLVALTTHDTKRSEDVRARLEVLAEVPEEWATTLAALRNLRPLDDKPLSNLLWQAVVGSRPASRERLLTYAEKAAREAGSSTSWTAPDDAFEEQVRGLINSAFDDPQVVAVIDDFVVRIRAAGWSNSLSAKLLQLTAVGVPDIYQGSELWETSLADPDNRRPVDFALRRRLLARLDAGDQPDIDEEGAAKLLVVSRALRVRRDHPDWFVRYEPLTVRGRGAAHVIAFDRGGAVTLATRLPVTLGRLGGWGGTTVDLPPPAESPGAGYVDAFTGTVHAGGECRAADVFHRYPVALLVPAQKSKSRA